MSSHPAGSQWAYFEYIIQSVPDELLTPACQHGHNFSWLFLPNKSAHLVSQDALIKGA
jgi:hypothetical protein